MSSLPRTVGARHVRTGAGAVLALAAAMGLTACTGGSHATPGRTAAQAPAPASTVTPTPTTSGCISGATTVAPGWDLSTLHVTVAERRRPVLTAVEGLENETTGTMRFDGDGLTVLRTVRSGTDTASGLDAHQQSVVVAAGSRAAGGGLVRAGQDTDRPGASEKGLRFSTGARTVSSLYRGALVTRGTWTMDRCVDGTVSAGSGTWRSYVEVGTSTALCRTDGRDVSGRYQKASLSRQACDQVTAD